MAPVVSCSNIAPDRAASKRNGLTVPTKTSPESSSQDRKTVDSFVRVILESMNGRDRARRRSGNEKNMKMLLFLPLLVVLPLARAGNPALPGATVLPLLPPGPGNPHNTEGSFVALRDGRILFAYSRFTGGGGDNDAASVVGRFSSDGGRTWTSRDTPIVE